LSLCGWMTATRETASYGTSALRGGKLRRSRSGDCPFQIVSSSCFSLSNFLQRSLENLLKKRFLHSGCGSNFLWHTSPGRDVSPFARKYDLALGLKLPARLLHLRLSAGHCIIGGRVNSAVPQYVMIAEDKSNEQSKSFLYMNIGRSVRTRFLPRYGYELF
jgi:hypothetical protein